MGKFSLSLDKTSLVTIDLLVLLRLNLCLTTTNSH